MSVYLIIGASSGIGEAVARKLSAEGHTLIGTYRDTPPPEINNVHRQYLDVTQDIPEQLFPAHLDGMVYCPGSILLKPFHRLSMEDFNKDMQVNVNGLLSVLQATYPSLKKSNQASVVTFSTVAVQKGFTFHSTVAASKGAIEGLTRANKFDPTGKGISCPSPARSDTQRRLA